MHDWTLLNINVDWKIGTITVVLLNENSLEVSIVCEGFVDLTVPRKEEWGRSVSVNSVQGPEDIAGGLKRLSLEIQSGDVIGIIAKSIAMPSSSSQPIGYGGRV